MKSFKKWKPFLKKYWTHSLLVLLVLGWGFNNLGPSTYTTGYYDDEGWYAMEEESYMVMESADMAYDGNKRLVAEVATDATVQQSEQKIIKSGSLSLHVDDVREQAAEIEAWATGLGGSLLDKSVTRGSNSYYGYLQVRVPAEQFEAAMEHLKDMAVYVSSEYSNAEDVTENYMDLSVRLSNYEAQEAQYLAILETATTVSDVLEVMGEISSVRYQIESIESQLQYYDTRIAYSLIDVSLSEDDSLSTVTETWRPLSTLNDAFGDWVAWLQDMTDKGIYVLIFGWPLALIGAGALWWKKRRR